ncbi:MAG: phosphoglycerate dehydrogenase [Oscillospiraceae bacterium]|nr:phosphoglycerate dehydrogenase [Oscillospiraceae bacterium]
MKVLVAERIAEDGVDLLKKDFDVDVKIGLSKEQLLDIIGEYDGVIVRSATKLTSDVLEKAVKLKVAGRAGTGVDNIDVDAATRKGIVVVNTPDGNSVAAAELTIGLIYSLFRNIPQAYAKGRIGDFRRSKIKGYELNEKVAGIIGFGRIGGLVAQRLKGSNMEVVAYDPYVSDDRFVSLGVRKCGTLDELLACSDLITIHMAKTEQTVNMIGEEQFNKMKKGVRIVNAARGGIIDEEALYKALIDGIVEGAALDVLKKEPNFELPPEEQTYKNKLLDLENVIYVPHLGASTLEAQYNVGVQIAKSVRAVLNGEMAPAVNMASMSKQEFEEIRPFMQLAEKLGAMYFQTEQSRLRKVEIKYSGDLLEKDTRLVTLAALKGLMDPIVEEGVNLVNAESWVVGRGIEVSVSKEKKLEKYNNLITLTFTTDERVQSLSGTVFAQEEIRIVDFYGYMIDFEPTPNVLAIQSIERPGLIGTIGTTLGNAECIISAMQWSRNKRGDKAVAFLSIDSSSGAETDILDQLRKISGVIKVSAIRF